MTPIERFLAIINFEKPDRLWRWETIGFWPETLKRWYNEGLPKIINNPVFSHLYFKFDPIIPILSGWASHPNLFPPYLKKIIKKSRKYKIIREPSGEIVQVFTDGSSAKPKYIDFPVKNMDDLRKISWRLNPDFPGRIYNPYNYFLVSIAKNTKSPLAIYFCGLFGMQRFLLGFEKLMTTYYDDPELIHAIGKKWEKLCIGYINKLTTGKFANNKIHLLSFWEDMCYVAGPMISPKLFEEFILPYYKRVIEFGKEKGISAFLVDTDGNCSKLIPLFIEAGVNCMLPFEVQAGMDIRKVRDEFGKKLVIIGGLNKRTLEKSKEEIKREVELKVPYMLKEGGYIPALDHCVHPDVPLENFKYFLKLIREFKP